MAETPLPKLLVSKEEAHQRIQKQIEEGQQFHDRQIYSDDELLYDAMLEADNWSNYNTDLLLKLFGELESTGHYIDRAYNQYSYSFSDYEIKNLEYEVREHKRSIVITINSLKGIQKRLELYAELLDVQGAPANEETSDNSAGTSGDDVFIVHGRDEAAKHAIARFVEGLDLKTIILDEQPDAGLTIIEKFEREARNVGFAIVLLTPDDIGTLKDEADEQLKFRARQNVIFELGYFMGKLGRKKVHLLIKGEIENPSDLNGILYASMNNPNEWQLKLARRMKQAELPIDPEKLLENR